MPPAAPLPAGPPGRRALSFLVPEQVAGLGQLPDAAILGFLEEEAGGTERFVPNPAFTALLHDTLRRVLPGEADWQQGAAQQGEGWLYVIDLRTPDGPQGKVPFHDIIGGFEVRDGRMLPDGYWANETYLAFTVDGSIRLPPGLMAALAQALLDPGTAAPRRE